jgi:hypothetical protein
MPCAQSVRRGGKARQVLVALKEPSDAKPDLPSSRELISYGKNNINARVL